jgi:hypothetical protein
MPGDVHYQVSASTDTAGVYQMPCYQATAMGAKTTALLVQESEYCHSEGGDQRELGVHGN